MRQTVLDGLIYKLDVHHKLHAKSWLFTDGVVWVATGIIIAVILVICVFGIKSCFKRLASGGGADGKTYIKKVKVTGNSRLHYDCCLMFEVGGMVCANCARRIKNALNILDGVCAAADLVEKGPLSV